MKFLVLTILICLTYLTAFAQQIHYSGEGKVTIPLDKEGTQLPKEEVATFLGIVYIGIPKEDLPKAGYTDLMKKGYRKENNEEWTTYLNWANPDSDKVTFYIVDGKVKGWKEQ